MHHISPKLSSFCVAFRNCFFHVFILSLWLALLTSCKFHYVINISSRLWNCLYFDHLQKFITNVSASFNDVSVCANAVTLRIQFPPEFMIKCCFCWQTYFMPACGNAAVNKLFAVLSISYFAKAEFWRCMCNLVCEILFPPLPCDLRMQAWWDRCTCCKWINQHTAKFQLLNFIGHAFTPLFVTVLKINYEFWVCICIEQKNVEGLHFGTLAHTLGHEIIATQWTTSSLGLSSGPRVGVLYVCSLKLCPLYGVHLDRSYVPTYIVHHIVSLFNTLLFLRSW